MQTSIHVYPARTTKKNRVLFSILGLGTTWSEYYCQNFIFKSSNTPTLDIQDKLNF